MQMKITVVSNKARTLEDLRQILEGSVAAATITYVERTGEALDLENADIGLPDLVLLDSPWQDRADMAAVEELSRRHPQSVILLLCPNRSSETLISAMRAGIREVLPSQASRKELVDAIERARKRIPVAVIDKPRGKILAFLSCKGGSGATFLATNLGYALAVAMGRKVLLVDLDLQYGDASFFMSSAKGVVSVAEVAMQVDHLDDRFLAASTIEVARNYSLLPAPEDAERAIEITPKHVENLLNVAVANYDFVIIDLERSIDAVSMKALDCADLIFPVLQALVPHVRDTQKVLRMFRILGYPDSKVRMVVNRSVKDSNLPTAKIESTLGVGIYRFVPNDFANVSASVNQGISILKLAPDCPVSQVLKEMAGDLTGAAKEQESWFGKLFRGERSGLPLN